MFENRSTFHSILKRGVFYFNRKCAGRWFACVPAGQKIKKPLRATNRCITFSLCVHTIQMVLNFRMCTIITLIYIFRIKCRTLLKRNAPPHHPSSGYSSSAFIIVSIEIQYLWANIIKSICMNQPKEYFFCRLSDHDPPVPLHRAVLFISSFVHCTRTMFVIWEKNVYLFV